MIEAPGIELVAESAPNWSFAGPLADRIQSTLHHIQERQSRNRQDRPDVNVTPARIQVVTAPPDHVGLGVGTQLSLAVVRIVLRLAGLADPSVESLAELSGRGRRSGIGLHGFRHGGLIVDGGRREEDHPPPLVAHVPFPEDWSILIVQPPGPRGRHGPDELQAFSDLPPLPDRVTERLCRLVLLGILPAVVERDLPAFGQAVIELQHHVGSAFAPLQGGLYASPESESLIAELTRLGLVGAGQSSWGPTIYAFGAISEPDRRSLASRMLDRWGLPPSAVLWTRAANHGAVLDRAGG
jgi:beta-ribofuranosylaminobenzene 5'-phosphate synthase